MSETNLVKRLMMSASSAGSRLFRNNVGMGWAPAGKGSQIVRVTQTGVINVHPGDVLVKKARPLHAGLQKGSGDLIGWSPVVITPDMVGKTLAVFTSAEAKTSTGQLRPEQKAWITTVRQHGGRAGVVRSEADLLELLAQLELDLESGG